MTTTYDGLNRGALFRNKYKHKATDCDYSGTLNIGGRKYSLFGWVGTSKNGVTTPLHKTKRRDDGPAEVERD
jgi:hypothetical protein